MVALNRMRRDLRTQASPGVALAKPGKSKREIIRCLKRYIAREVYRVLAVTQPELAPREEDLASSA